VMEDIGADAVKTGMLSSASIIDVVADRLEAWGIANLVIDPVMVAKSGDALLQASAVRALATKLLPLALIVTPNIPEAEVLSKREIRGDDDAKEAAKAIAALGPRFVVIKGGHRGGEPIDLVFDGTGYAEFATERVDTENTHGTGCTFSAAIAAYLAHGLPPLDAISGAKDYLTGALRAGYAIGAGHSPVNHFYNIRIDEPTSLVTRRS
jgi:hydroxymethylpyrimidine/phosphomethylpyrimidine kinase